jgi:hypothetical protein
MLVLDDQQDTATSDSPQVRYLAEQLEDASSSNRDAHSRFRRTGASLKCEAAGGSRCSRRLSKRDYAFSASSASDDAPLASDDTIEVGFI